MEKEIMSKEMENNNYEEQEMNPEIPAEDPGMSATKKLIIRLAGAAVTAGIVYGATKLAAPIKNGVKELAAWNDDRVAANEATKTFKQEFKKAQKEARALNTPAETDDTESEETEE